MRKTLFFRLLTFYTISSLFLQSVLPFYSVVFRPVLAQDSTSTKSAELITEEVPTGTPVPEITIEPTILIEPTVVVPIESLTPTVAVDSIVVPTVEPPITPTDQIRDGISTQVNSQITPTETLTLTPTNAPALPDETVAVDIIKLDGSYADPTLVPATWTDKLDYHPYEKVTVSGKNFIPGASYTVVISSQDTDLEKIVHTGKTVALEDGSITFEDQLGEYRALYLVEVKDDSGAVVATTTFTDSRTTNSVTLNGGATTAVLANATIAVVMQVTTTGSNNANDWQSVSWRISTLPGSGGTSGCVNVGGNTSGANVYTENFTVTAPNTSGIYNAYFIPYSGTNCASESSDGGLSGAFGGVNGMVNSVVVDTSAPVITITNPNITPSLSKTITASTNEGTLSLFVNAVGINTCNSSLTFVPYTSKTFNTEADNGKKVCYRAVDAATNTTYSLSNAIGGIDTTAPTVVISSPSSNPTNQNPIPVTFTFSEVVTGFIATDITLSGATPGTLTPISGSIYTMNIVPTANIVTVNVASGKATDVAGNGNSAATQLSRTYDATAPVITITNPSTTPSLSKTITASTNEGTLSLFVNAMGINTCNSSLTFVPYTSKTFNTEADNGKRVCYQAVDGALNTTYLLSNAIEGIDTTAPSVTSVSSSSLDGSYAVGQVLPITITFSESVIVNPILFFSAAVLRLETGITDRYVYYSSGSGTNTLTFNYTVQSGDMNSDLDYVSTSALDLFNLGQFVWGTIQDTVGHDANLTLPVPGTANSLSANKNIAIGTTPSVLVEVTPISSPTNNTTPSYTFSSTKTGTIIYGGSCSSGTTSAGIGNNTVTFTALAQGTYTNCTIQVSTSGVLSNILTLSAFTIDTTAPSVPLNGTPHNTSISTNNFDFNWDASTDTSSITYEYHASMNPAQVSGVLTTGLWTSGILSSNTIHSSGAPDGTWYWQVRAMDSVGNVSAWSTIWNVTLDTVSPTVDLIFPTPGPSATSFQAVFSENVVQTEAETAANYFLHNWPGAGGSGDLTGDVSISYDGPTKTATITFTNPGWYVSPEQEWGVENIHDNAGNVIVVNPYSETSTPLVAPVTTVSGIDSLWHTSDVTLTFTCSDVLGSGCKKTYYSIDGAAYSVGTSALLSTNGKHTVSYYSEDNAGNSESPISEAQTVNVDKTAPSTTNSVISSNWVNSDVTVTFSCTDSNSGCAHTYFTTNGDTPTTSSPEGTSVTLSSTGTYPIKYFSVDIAGNEEMVQTATESVKIDKIDPESTITSPVNSGTGSTIYTNNWTGAIQGAATDDRSGVNSVKVSIQKGTTQYFNGTSFVTSETEILLSTTYGDGEWQYAGLTSPVEGSYTIKSHAVDNATNIENTYTLTVIFDKTIPEVLLAINPTLGDAANGWYKTQPEVTLTATDDILTDHIEYQWDTQSGVWTTYVAPFKPVTEGSHVLYYRAQDKALNYSEVGIKNIKWNKTELKNGPLNVNVSPNPTSESTSKVKWDAAESETIGIDKYEIQWKLKSGGDKTYTVSVGGGVREYTVDNLTEGVWEVKVTAFDASGFNKSASADLTVDRTGPTAPTLSIYGTSVGSVSLSWNKIDGANNYILWYGTNSGTYLYGAKVGDTQNYTVQGLGGGSYYFIVRAVDPSGNQSGNSNEVSTGAITGAPGVAEGTPAQGFAEQVLGANTITPTPSLTPTGTVLGSSSTTGKKSPWWWPWILLLLLPPTWYGFKQWKKSRITE